MTDAKEAFGMNRPIMKLNPEFQGIELKFESKPSPDTLAQIKEQGFRWHTKKKIWFAKETEARREFAEKLSGTRQEQKPEAAMPAAQKVRRPAAEQTTELKRPNTFAASYDKIGDTAILEDANICIGEHMAAFCEKEHLYYGRTYGCDSITLYDLSNAQKTGKNCDWWSIGTGYGGDLLSSLQQAGIDSVAKLAECCRSGGSPDGISIYHHTIKAVDVFSPFVEVKPLKDVPDKWTKRNFEQALMSGQIFRGEVAYHYTDDYRMDAAINFGEGSGLNMPAFVSKVIGSWSKSTTCYGGKDGPDKNGAYQVHYSEYSNSGKTFWFDVNCDIAEGKRRAEAREAALQNYNKMLKDSCIKVDPAEISPDKVYEVQCLEKDLNTEVYSIVNKTLQGENLRDRLDPECSIMDVLSVKEMEIQPDLFYSVANFHDRLSNMYLDDKRIIPAGNFEHIVTGKALLEMTAEGHYFPCIRKATGEIGPSFETARTHLMKLETGAIRFMMGGDKTNYTEALSRLTSEYQRAGGVVKEPEADRSEPAPPRRSFQDLLNSAQERAAASSSESNSKGPHDVYRS